MADIFTFVKGNKKKVYNIAGGTEEEAIKYVRYLHRNALFGTHTGLPQKIRNSKMNESLVSNIGDYSVLDVYAYPQTKCIIGTVVNFHISNDVNPFGETYVYPCTDKNKPMGYMISDATPDTMGVCLVHGVLEVPLYYFSGSTEEKKDFVEYDIENACFKFSDSGYPVFNVYQDVDGDWIAIILFGNTKSDYEYDGPFAVSVTGVTGSTTFVDVLGGDVFFNDVRDICDDLTVPIGISTGESLWLSTAIVGSTHSYDFIVQSTAPIDGSTVFYTKIAENNDGDIRQIHYGDIRYSRTKIIAGSNKITVSPSNGLGDVTIDINESVIGGGTFYTPNYTQLAVSGGTVPEGYLGQTFVLPVRAGTVGFFDDGGDARAVWTDKDGSTSVQLTSGNLYPATKDGWLRVSVIDGGTSSGACLSIQDSTGNLPIYKYGSFVNGGTSSSFDYTGSFKVDCWDTEDEGVVHNVRIYDSNNRDDDVGYAGWVHIGSQKYHVSDYTDTFSDGDVIYLIGTFNESNELSSFEFRKIQTFFPTINDNQFCVRICYATNGKMYQTQYGDIVQPARLVADGETTEIHNNVISAIGGGGGGTVQGLYSAIKGGTPAICITGSTTYVPIAGGTNTYTERDSSGAIIVGSTANVSGSVGFPDYGGNREPVSFGAEYGPYTYDVWLIGECGIYGGTAANIVLHLGGRTITLYDYHTSGQDTVTNYIPVCIPVSASSQRSIRVVKGTNDNSDMELYIYRCL